jgi:hypothetical protein
LFFVTMSSGYSIDAFGMVTVPLLFIYLFVLDILTTYLLLLYGLDFVESDLAYIS